MRGHIKYISNRLSLRKPQNEALISLEQFLDRIGLPMEESIGWAGLTQAFPGLSDFERDFPNVCFSLATGVGKTRLMGAMVAYLVLAKRVRNFLILAPNSTILEKLTRDFSDPTYSKYVFKGIPEFASKRPKIITADNFDEGYGVRNDRAKQGDLFSEQDDIHINIFNIAKMHTDKRKIKQLNDYLEISYFDYLSSLEDLVVLMDEAHQYRAKAGSKTIQELKPLLGLEFTATPQIERGGKSIRFKNIAYDYPLSAALTDGYLKEPAVVGRENFDRKNFATEEEFERLKIEDGIRIHEKTKLSLQTYSDEVGKAYVKPLMLIVAQDTKHADQIQKLIESDQFFNGDYREKSLVVHSELKSDLEEIMIRNLLEVESSNNPIEIVIHVNMLREGWDVKNLYTMVPLRKANSKTLIEQNLGRGLRLPYGKKTGREDIDTHYVVSHDRFNELIDSANKEDSVIRRGVIIGKDVAIELQEMLQVVPRERLEIDKIEDEEKREITKKVFEAIHSFGMESKEEIIDLISQSEKFDNFSLIENTVVSYLENNKRQEIFIPRISIQPRVIKEACFSKFQLELSEVKPRPYSSGLIAGGLVSGKITTFKSDTTSFSEEQLRELLMMHLFEYDEVSEENIEVVQDCVEQMLQHLKSYLNNMDEVSQVVRQQSGALAKIIFKQMLNHFEDSVIEWDTSVKQKRLPLPTMRLPSPKSGQIKHYTLPVEDKLNIRGMLFEGFNKSVYPLVKFDSDSERVFSVILENDQKVIKWLKPGRGAFNYIHYTKDYRYEPDFIIETVDSMYLVEIKRKCDMTSSDVIAKAKAGAYWCGLAADQAKKNGHKSWEYLLIPHDALHLSMTLEGLAAKYTYSTFLKHAERI